MSLIERLDQMYMKRVIYFFQREFLGPVLDCAFWKGLKPARITTWKRVKWTGLVKEFSFPFSWGLPLNFVLEKIGLATWASEFSWSLKVIKKTWAMFKTRGGKCGPFSQQEFKYSFRAQKAEKLQRVSAQQQQNKDLLCTWS